MTRNTIRMIRDVIQPETWVDIVDWAMDQKRITHKMIRGRFGLDLARADLVYEALKQEGIIESMGYVANKG